MKEKGTRYNTIVVDPPWHYDRFLQAPDAPSSAQRTDGVPVSATFVTRPLDYPTMTVAEITELPVGDLAAPDAHLYLWTTNRYLPVSFSVVEAWGFRYVLPLIWCKDKGGVRGGTYTSNVEYALFCRRGSCPAKQRIFGQWFEWGRQRVHSKKPEAFLDMVETVSPGPYLEMFARRQRLGWDTWGNEALNHVEVAV